MERLIGVNGGYVVPQASHFQRVWIAATAGGLSNWMVQVALFYAVLRLHGATELAWVVLAGNLPALLLGPFMGAAVDRWNAGTAALLAGIVQAVSLFAVGGLLSGSLAALALTYACYNASNSLGRTARQRLLYEVIPPPARARANASIGSASGIVTIVGAALGGGAALFGPLPILVAAVAVRLAGTASLYGARPTRSAVQVPGAKEPYWHTLADGFRSVRAFPRATSVLLVGVAWGLIGGGYDVLLSDYGVHVFHGGGGGLSALYVADGVGVVLGTLAARKVGTGLKGHLYGWAYMFQGAFWILFALSGRLVLAVPLLLFMRIASGVIIAWDTTLLLETVPDRLHGRIYSLHSATYGSVMQISLALTGVLLAVVGVRGVAVGAGVGSLAVGLTWWLAVGRRWSGDSPAALGVGHSPRNALGSTAAAEGDPPVQMRAVGT